MYKDEIKFLDDKEKEGGRISREKEEGKVFHNLEREVKWENEYFGPKNTYILPCASLLKCPSSWSRLT